ncbi:MAG: TolC family protein [Gammaproteobacteria bacterium]|nr:TolC family protein [Gammaproteobacteria bacterium]
MRGYKSFIFTLISLFFIPALIYARPACKDPNLALLIQKALQCNPQIQAARHRWLASRSAIPQASSLPDPMIEYEYRNVPVDPEMEEIPVKESMYGVRQEIPFPGKLVVRRKIARLQSEKMCFEYHASCRMVISQLKKMYYSLYFANKSVEILQKNKDILVQMEKVVRANYVVGKVPQQDIFRSQVEISRNQMRIIILCQEKATLAAEINKLLNCPLETPVRVSCILAITPICDLCQLYHQMEHCSPQFHGQLAQVEKNRKAIQLSQLDYLPDFEIGAYRIKDHAMDTEGSRVMLGATVPLYFATKQNYAVRQASFEYAAGVDDLFTTRQNLLFQIKNSVLQAERNLDLIHLLQTTIIPQGRLTWSSAQASYGVGKVDFFTVLNSLLTLQENEIELHREITEHEKAVAQIEEVTGMCYEFE